MQSYTDTFTTEVVNSSSESEERSQTSTITESNDYTETEEWEVNAEIGANAAMFGLPVSGSVGGGYSKGSEFSESFSSEDINQSVSTIENLV